MTLRSRLLAVLVPAILGSMLLLVYGNYRASRLAILLQVDREAQALGKEGAQRMATLFQASRKVADGVAVSVGAARTLEATSIQAEQQSALAENPVVLGIAVAFEPAATPLKAFASYVHREGSGFRTRSLAGNEYRYLDWAWFRLPMQRGQGSWGDPYLDTAVHKLMVTYSAPIQRGGRRIGVATVDITLDQLAEQLQRLQSGLGTFAYLTNGNGKVIAASRLAELRGQKAALDKLKDLIRTPGMSRAEMLDPVSGQPSWIVEQPIASLSEASTEGGWSLILSTPTETLLRPLDQLRSHLLWGSLGLAVLVMGVIYGMAFSLTRPLQELTRQAQRYSAGCFEEAIPETRGVREIQDLSKAFNAMGSDIVRRIEEIRVTTEQRERYHQELAIAAEFQQAILPKQVPPFPEWSTVLDLHGLMQPAKEVGGDFFDFFRLPSGHLGLVVGDVSDKGAPAALFMTQARLLVRFLARQGLEPAEVLRRANYVLAEDAPGNMFVTLAYLDYDPADGQGVLVSAGHPSPILTAPGEAPRELGQPRALPLGAFPSTRYVPVPCVIPEHGLLLLYSDGLSEAMNTAGEAFGLARVLATLASARVASCSALADALAQEIKAFAGVEPPWDDLTLLLLRRLPGTVAAPRASERLLRLELPAETGVLALVGEVITQTASRVGLGPRPVAQFALAVDEAIANVIHHAYGGEPSRRFLLDLEATGDGIRAVVTDTGLPFDFAAATGRYDGHADPNQAVGGVGLFLMGKLVDECSYEPGSLEGNRLVLLKRRDSQPTDTDLQTGA